ncbi:type II toxin-antitoxin system CcdA family antitoxin [Nitratifractor sp.]
MTAFYDRKAKKRAINLSVNSDLLAQAKALGINLSQSFEKNLEELVRREKERRWLEENREAIEERNRFVEKHGLFWEKFRTI